jgi:hypothetical protein
LIEGVLWDIAIFGFLSMFILMGHDTIADPWSLKAALQEKLSDKDGIDRRRGLQPAGIVARDCDDAYLCQLPLLPEAFALPGHIQLQRLDDRPHALEIEPLEKGEVLGMGETEDELVIHERHYQLYAIKVRRCRPRTKLAASATIIIGM